VRTRWPKLLCAGASVALGGLLVGAGAARGQVAAGRNPGGASAPGYRYYRPGYARPSGYSYRSGTYYALPGYGFGGPTTASRSYYSSNPYSPNASAAASRAWPTGRDILPIPLSKPWLVPLR